MDGKSYSEKNNRNSPENSVNNGIGGQERKNNSRKLSSEQSSKHTMQPQSLRYIKSFKNIIINKTTTNKSNIELEELHENFVSDRPPSGKLIKKNDIYMKRNSLVYLQIPESNNNDQD